MRQAAADGARMLKKTWFRSFPLRDAPATYGLPSLSMGGSPDSKFGSRPSASSAARFSSMRTTVRQNSLHMSTAISGSIGLVKYPLSA